MKKLAIILVIFIFYFLIWLWFSNFYNIKKYILNSNYEYIQINSWVVLWEAYTSSKNINYYFLGSFKWLDFTQVRVNDIYKYISYYWKGIFVINNFNKKILYILFNKDFFENRSNVIKQNCLKIDNKSVFKFLTYHPDNIVINFDNILSDNINKNWLSCAYYWRKLVFNTNEFTKDDMYFLVNNYKFLYRLINSFEKFNWSNLIKNIYLYILKNTEYDYDTLKRLENGLKPYPYAWQIATFFKWWKLVCDGYVKTFMFLLNSFGYNPERIVGKVQPIDSNNLQVYTILHSWVKLDNKYYDLTFDDTISDDNKSLAYFWKSKICFNLDHYTSWWVLFRNINDRWNYIKKYHNVLYNECPKILSNVLISDKKVVDYIKFIFVKYNNIDYISSNICNLFSICLKEKDKQSLIKKLRQYKLFVNRKGKRYTIDFSRVDLLTWKVVKSKKDINLIASNSYVSNYSTDYYIKQKAIKLFKYKIKPLILKYPSVKQNHVRKLLIYYLIKTSKKIEDKNKKKLFIYLARYIYKWK